MGFTVKVEWQLEDGSIASAELGTMECGPCRSASDLGLVLADAKPILNRLQQVSILSSGGSIRSSHLAHAAA